MYTERSDRHAQMQIVILVPKLNSLGMRQQERSSLGTVSVTDRVQCMQMSSIDDLIWV